MPRFASRHECTSGRTFISQHQTIKGGPNSQVPDAFQILSSQNSARAGLARTQSLVIYVFNLIVCPVYLHYPASLPQQQLPDLTQHLSKSSTSTIPLFIHPPATSAVRPWRPRASLIWPRTPEFTPPCHATSESGDHRVRTSSFID
jgi:hypothetical protein